MYPDDHNTPSLNSIRKEIDLPFPKVVIFDLDGTLYDETKLRKKMIWKILLSAATNPGLWKEVKILWHFRRAREINALNDCRDIAHQQYLWGAEAAKVTPEKVRHVVQKWIFEIPLHFLSLCRYPGVLELFFNLKKIGILTAVFSDYPVAEKIRALGLHPDAFLCATDSEVDRLKPDPAGLRLLAQKFQIPVSECLFIGNRDEKDGACARRIGMPYMILDRKCTGSNCFRSYHQLNRWIKKNE